MKIEDGWEILADGLHIQRYFLHIRPWFKDELKNTNYATENIWDLSQKYSSNLLSNAGYNLEVSKEISYLYKTWDSHFIEEQTRLDLKKALDLIEKSDLLYIATLGTGTFLGGSSEKFYPFCTFIKKDSSILDIALQILLNSSRSIAYGFIKSFDIDLANKKYWESPWSKDIVSTEEMVLQIFSKSICYNFLVKINHDDDVILSEYRKLKSVEENLPEILMEVNHENISDYINLYFPQDSKFKKYWYGKGAGQS
ncbi:hypothetical protein [Bacillus cereus]|uniref:hypothetical protein n=1 Tax=Bacillus cereus TaxID=1396 RepID=UPI00094428EA|nr:hypothetical protein [Bacillus cereus]